ncbi:helix-turn-helix domain-containing protein, partial [Streptomyces scabiei]|nr:helix-turn-helix domain-containing protein [Streptomyces scabiei]MDX3566041.1 helix-turn-helix domain-containing protein [Streptomyces scabiei]
MDTQNPSVHPHAQARPTGKNNPRRSTRTGGVIHDNSRHSTRFTVVGNHLAQHPELSALAIGLAVHIQSLPTGARVDIRTLAGRFPESPARIAAGLRELETHGYLRRTRERTEGGRIVTRTVSCNHPGRHGDAPADAPEHAAGAPAACSGASAGASPCRP